MNSWKAWKLTRAAPALAIITSLALSIGCAGEGPGTGEESESEPATAHSHPANAESCFICDASKRETGRLWCREHTRYEDRCWLCQPQLEDKSRAYCKEHFLYEDECFLCHPELKNADSDGDSPAEEKTTSSAISPPTSGLYCKEHRVPEADCGICQPQLTAGLNPGDELKVRFESNRSAAKAGLRTAPARPTGARASVHAVCEVTYNENRLARITPLVPGIVKRVLVDVGKDVKVGDLLLEIHSTEAASAKAEYVSARVDMALKEIALKREQGLVEKKISSAKELQEAEAAYKTARLSEITSRQALINLDFSDDEIQAIQKDQDCSAIVFLRAPFDGTLVDRTAVPGEAVEPGDALFTLADLSRLWLTLSIPADRASLLAEGLEVEAALDGDAGPGTRGELTWLSPSIDKNSRLLKGRAVVENPDRRLRAGMYGEAEILLSGERSALGVPRGAIQRYERKPYVFVRLEDDLYSLRRVVIERPSGDLVPIVAGLRENEPVVVEGAFTVMSEFLKSRLGAGCVDD